ncbi:MAG: TonB-dependent receptor [Prevotella sp.]|nr:TonB-dependent receptor [Prevotella sp.]
MLLLLGFISAASAGAQNIITGTVTDESNEPLIGVSVAVKNTTKGTMTDLDGKYSITVNDQNTVLVFSLVGYTKQERKVGSQTVINISLAEDTKELDEVVVVGFQTQKKVNLTGAISSVGADAFENRPVTNIGQALQGVVPNLNISMNDGKPNTVPNFNIRGTTSIDYNENEGRWELQNGSPLILVDGVEMSATLVNQLNPNDIEGMSVIKDASAAAIYGTKATFGVILITTKSGKFNQKGKINYSYDLSWDKPAALPDIMNAYEIQRFVMQNAEWTSIGGTASDLDKRKMEGIERYMSDPTNPDNRYIMNGSTIVWTGNMNPYKLIVKDWTPTQKHNLSVSGGTDKVAYNLSLGYLTEDGMYKIGKDKYNRYNVSTHFNAKVTDWFNVEVRANYNRNSYDEPYVPSYKGNIWSVLKQDADKNINMPIKTLESDPCGEQWTDNFLAWYGYGSRTVTNRWTTVLAVSPEFIVIPKTLKLKADLYYTPQGRTMRRVNPSHYYITYTWMPVSEQAEYKENLGTLEKDVTDNYQINVYADFNKTFKGNHTLSAIVGYNQEYVDYSSSGLYLHKLLSPNILNPSATEDPTLNRMETEAQRRTGRALFGRVNYNFAGKYLFEMNGRYDGSSRFTPGGRFFFFPSFSAGWRVSEEQFMDFSKNWLSNMKIRFSYGKLGSQPDRYYPYQPLMESAVANYLLDGSWPNTVKAPNLISPYLTWEKAATTNYAIDLGFFNNRLNASLDVYERKTTDILVDGGSAFPNLLGVQPPRENSGVLRSRGWELSMNWADKLTNGLQYNVGLVLSDATSKVLNYPSNAIKALGDYNFYTGMTVGEIWGYETGGILQKEDLTIDGNKYVFDGPYHTGTLYPGDPWYKDLNGDGVINSGSNTADDPGDRRIIGNSTPRYNFGVTLGASWKGFDINMLFQGVGKRDLWIGSTSYWGGGTNNAGSKWMYERSWKPDQTDANFPRYRSTAGGPSVQTGWLVNGAYLRMKQAVLGYTIPTSLIRKLHIEKLRFTLSGYNLFEITEIPSILDPDQISDAYPQKRTIAVGAQITF